MQQRIFDITLLIASGAFVLQAILTPPETFDVFGPALWPMSVAIAVVLMLAIVILSSRAGMENTAITLRLLLFAILVCAFVGVQSLEFLPFYVTTSAFLFLAYLAMTVAFEKREAMIVALACIAFAFCIQVLFTDVIHLDLPTDF